MDDTITFKIDITNPDLQGLVNQLVPKPISLLRGDILKLSYTLNHDFVVNQDIIGKLKLVIEILKDSGATIESCPYKKFIEFRNLISELNEVLEDLDVEVALQLADDSATREMMAERLSDPNHQPTAPEAAFVEAVLRANQSAI